MEEQLRVANETNEALLMRLAGCEETIARMSAQMEELVKTNKSLEKALLERDDAVRKKDNQNWGLLHLIGNKSEKQDGKKGPSSVEEPGMTTVVKESKDIKSRGNNGARRKERIEMEEEHVDVYPSEASFDLSRALEMGVSQTVRYEMVPMKVRKIIYHLHKYVQDGTIYEGTAPRAPFVNSSYMSSFISEVACMRYCRSMPVERIAKMLRDGGFDVGRSTLNGLLSKTADLLEPLHKAIYETVMEDDYLNCDETYHNVMVGKSEPSIKKCYFWGITGRRCGLTHFTYRDGSRGGGIARDLLSGYRGTIQSDGYAVYKSLGGGILRLPCLQHCKRKFLDQADDPLAMQVVDLMNELYIQERKHKVGRDGWTKEDNLLWRQEYSPPILKRLKTMLTDIKSGGKYPEGTLMCNAVNYTLGEWDGIENIFTSGEYDLDNNIIERENRRISLSRRNSLFFGSHRGAERGAIFFSIACSCDLNGINMQEYLADVIDKIIDIPPGSATQKYRGLLPDRWRKTGE